MGEGECDRTFIKYRRGFAGVSANEAAMRVLVADLQARRAGAAEGGPPRSRELICRGASFCRAIA